MSISVYLACLLLANMTRADLRIFDEASLQNVPYFGMVEAPVPLNSLITGCLTSQDCCTRVYAQQLAAIQHLSEARDRYSPLITTLIASLEAAPLPAINGIPTAEAASFKCADLRHISRRNIQPVLANRINGPWYFVCPFPQRMKIQIEPHPILKRHLHVSQWPDTTTARCDTTSRSIKLFPKINILNKLGSMCADISTMDTLVRSASAREGGTSSIAMTLRSAST